MGSGTRDFIRYTGIYISIGAGLFFLFFPFLFPLKEFYFYTFPFPLTFKIDKLSVFFIIIISLISFFVSVFSITYGKEYREKPHIFLLTPAFILSMIFVVLSNDIITFLIFWELMSLSSFFLVISEGKPESKKAGLLYFIMTHIGTVFITAGFVLLYLKSSSLSFGGYKNIAGILILGLMITGFSVKAGLFPFHVWLPHAHPATPSNISAIMSAAMVNVAVYGVIRVLFVFGLKIYPFLGIILLVFGALSAFFGIMNALVQTDIKRMLAFSTIENIGIIYMGIGLSFWAYSTSHAIIGSLAFMAALLHILNHSLSKSSLFMGSGVLVKNVRSRNMEELGGLAKRMGFFSVLFLIAVMSISAIPPLNGFLGEWYLYVSLVGATQTSNLYIIYFSIISIALLSLTGAIAGAAFAKLYGITFLGKHRSEKARNAGKTGIIENISIFMPVFLCVAIGVYPYPLISFLNGVSLYLSGTKGALSNSGHFLAVQTFRNFSYSSYYPLLLISGILGLLFIGAILIKIFSNNSLRRYKTWGCGIEEENRAAQFSGSGFSYGIMKVFSTFYSRASEIKFDSEVKKYFRKDTFYSEEIGDILEKRIYDPIKRIIVKISGYADSIFETGSMNLSLLFIFLALVLCFIIYLFLVK